jgi:hypothetical protein
MPQEWSGIEAARNTCLLGLVDQCGSSQRGPPLNVAGCPQPSLAALHGSLFVATSLLNDLCVYDHVCVVAAARLVT